MAVNLIVADGLVKSLALRYASDGKPELRFTLQQVENGFSLWLPCCAAGHTALRLAEQLEDGQHIVITNGKLCYRRRQTQKSGEVSRLEILVWTVDRLTASSGPAQADAPEGGVAWMSPRATWRRLACLRRRKPGSPAIAGHHGWPGHRRGHDVP